MIRQIAAAASIALFATAAMAQDATTTDDTTINATGGTTGDGTAGDPTQLPLPRTSDTGAMPDSTAMNEDGVAVEGTGSDSTFDANNDSRSDDGQPLTPQ
jgi:hypothetical protein